MQVDSPFGRIFHWMKKRGRNPKSAPKGAKPRADQSGTIRDLSKSSLAAPAAWAAFCRGKNPGDLLRLSPPKIPSAAKKKNHPKLGGCFGAGYEARTRYLHLGKVALYQMS